LFVIFFALKNTPLAFLTAWSYERLNCLHRIAGYTAVAHAIIHTGFYAYYFCTHDMCNRLVALTGIFGTVAGLAWVLMALTAMVLRRWWYELFYYVHIVLWVVSVVSLGIHQPNLGNKISIATVVAGSMWGLDRLIRFVRLMVNSANNMAIVTPLPNGGTRVTLAKTPAGTTSGKHFFLWIPRIRMAETHPFTITSAEPLEFVIASHNGFTGDLHKFAVNNPGVPLTASVEGPYGTVPDLSKFETVVLVAGGSGATFTFGLAHALLAKAKRNAVTKRVYFVWVIKYNCTSCYYTHALNVPQFANE
jgi:predicted ferric reductase